MRNHFHTTAELVNPWTRRVDQMKLNRSEINCSEKNLSECFREKLPRSQRSNNLSQRKVSLFNFCPTYTFPGWCHSHHRHKVHLMAANWKPDTIWALRTGFVWSSDISVPSTELGWPFRPRPFLWHLPDNFKPRKTPRKNNQIHNLIDGQFFAANAKMDINGGVIHMHYTWGVVLNWFMEAMTRVFSIKWKLTDIQFGDSRPNNCSIRGEVVRPRDHINPFISCWPFCWAWLENRLF